MTLRKWLLAILVSMSPTGAYASNDIKMCRSYLKTAIKLIDNLESVLPDVPKDSEQYFSSHYRSMGLPKFYREKTQPHYYLWLLHHDITEAKSHLEVKASDQSSTDARSSLASSGYLAYFLSNVRNSWSEYAAYAADKSISDSQKDSISSDLLQVIALFNFYSSCLVQNLDIP